MKKKVKVISLTLCLVLCVSFLTGCYADERKFLYKKMDEFEIECNEYKLIQSDEELDSEQYALLAGNCEGDFLLDGANLKIEYEGNLDGYKITYRDNELEINSRFMGEHSDTYYNIHKIWSTWNNKNNEEYEPDFTVSDVAGIIVYDNEIFIVIRRQEVVIIKREYGNIPLHMYKFNISTNELLYCGYLKKPEGSSSYLKYKYITKNTLHTVRQ
ncbi:MAG: hypothetical protein IK147_04090 [Clostridia bacterium]|nr:hypothetical protein [Clostridia bacterium]